MIRPSLFVVVVMAGVPIAAAAGPPDPSLPAHSSIAENSELVEPLRRAFEEGYVIGAKRVQEAQKHLAQARKLAPKDPRVEYTHGLLFVKQTQLKQAAPHFQSAIEVDGAYRPAWQASIWVQLADKRYDTGLKQLVEFSRMIERLSSDGVTEEQRDACRWIGQIVGAMSHTDDAKRFQKLLAEKVDEIHVLLNDELYIAVEEGRETINEREAERREASGLARQTVEHQDQLRRDRKTADLEKNLENADKARADNEKSKDEWKSWLDEELAKLDKELGRLEGDYRFLDQRAQSLSQSITQVGQELTAMEFMLGAMNPRTTAPAAGANAQQQYLQRQNTMVSYQLEYNATIGRMQGIAQAGAAATQKRAETIGRYEKATGDLVKQNANLDKWSDRMKSEKKKLAIHKAAKLPKNLDGDKNADKAADKRIAPATFKSIMPFDLQHEKERVLTSLAPPSENEIVDAAGDR
jgi:hypothetical protein